MVNLSPSHQGDCCSHTWIEEVLNFDALLMTPVLNVDDIELSEEFQQPTKHPDQYEEEMQYYGLAIETAKGRCVIAYRNSSNGYYGGSLSWPGDYSHQVDPKITWKEIK